VTLGIVIDDDLASNYYSVCVTPIYRSGESR
jgi:hypothetical protein